MSKSTGQEMAEIEGVARKVSEYFRSRPEVAAAYVFGSLAQGRGGPSSDADVAVLTLHPVDKRQGLALRLRYASDLEQRLRRPVDVVLLHGAGEVLAEEIIRRGLLVYEAYPEQHRSWRAHRVLRFLDFVPARRLMEKGLAAARNTAFGAYL